MVAVGGRSRRLRRAAILVRVAAGSSGAPGSGWAAMRPLLVGCLLAVDAFAVAALAIARPGGWFPPFLAFGSLLVGLIWFELWALRHRHDDD
jgi:hypothetical protein